MNSLSLATLLIISGLLLSLNPFSISIFCSLMAGALGKGHPKSKLHSIALAYLLAYWVFTAILGIIIVIVLSLMSVKNLQITALIVAGLAILWGMFSLKYYFWDKTHKNAPSKLHSILHTHTVKKSSPQSATIVGIIACLTSFWSIGIQLLALAVIVALVSPSAPQWMLVPAICLILPLKLIYWQVLRGYKISAILKWRDEARAMMRLSIALVHIALGWIILLILNGTIGTVL